MVRVGIVGSRSFRNMEQVKDYVKSLDKDTIIVSGGGKVSFIEAFLFCKLFKEYR